MDKHLERWLMIVVLLLIVALTVYSMVTQLAAGAYDAGVIERATVAARASAVAGTLTAIK